MLKRSIFSLSLSLVFLTLLDAAIDGIVPSAPVKNFRFPRFGENGYTEWILQGVEGIYDGEEQIRVNGMGLRIYTGDERMVIEMSLDSPQAILRLKENKAYSDAAITITGQDFKITGIGWKWDGTTREIEVKEDTVVEFTQSITDTSGGMLGSAASKSERTVIQSEHLKLRTTEKFHYFNFREDVHVVSEDMELKCNALLAVADAPEDKKQGIAKAVTLGQLKLLREIRARGDVIMTQADRLIKAGAADFFPREELVNLGDTPSVRVSGVYVAGELIRVEKGEIKIIGGEEFGRAQTILSKAGGLGIQGSSVLSSETIIVADKILMRELEAENTLNLNGSVEVISGALRMRSGKMMVFADKNAESFKEKTDSTVIDRKLNIGKVNRIVAEDKVYIEQNRQIAISDRAVFYPFEERAVLTGDLMITNGEAVIAGQAMQLKQGLAVIEGGDENGVSVTLPALPDFGYSGIESLANAVTTTDEELKSKKEATKSKKTMILSKIVRMVEEPEQTRFEFRENVQISATNLEVTCECLDIIAREKIVAFTSPESPNGRLEEYFHIQSIVANEEVTIQQSGRVATARQAVILPRESRVILEGDAVVTDEKSRVSGYRLILNAGERRVIIEGGEGKRAKITLPELQSEML